MGYPDHRSSLRSGVLVVKWNQPWRSPMKRREFLKSFRCGAAGSPDRCRCRQAEHPLHPCRRPRLRRSRLLRAKAHPDAEPRPPGRSRDALHAGLRRQHGLRALALLPDDGLAHGTRHGARQQETGGRHPGAGDNRREPAETGRLPHGPVRQVGAGRPRHRQCSESSRLRQLLSATSTSCMPTTPIRNISGRIRTKPS